MFKLLLKKYDMEIKTITKTKGACDSPYVALITLQISRRDTQTEWHMIYYVYAPRLSSQAATHFQIRFKLLVSRIRRNEELASV